MVPRGIIYYLKMCSFERKGLWRYAFAAMCLTKLRRRSNPPRKSGRERSWLRRPRAHPAASVRPSVFSFALFAVLCLLLLFFFVFFFFFFFFLFCLLFVVFIVCLFIPAPPPHLGMLRLDGLDPLHRVARQGDPGLVRPGARGTLSAPAYGHFRT